jgi:hypothetical protein
VATTHDHEVTALPEIGRQPPRKPKRNKGSLAMALGMLVCVAACTLPLLLAGGLVAGVAALTDWDAVALIILIATGGGAVVWWQRKRAAAARGVAAGGPNGCGCGSGGC